MTARTAAVTSAIALLATPAFGQGQSGENSGQGQATSPAKICKSESRKKTNHGKGKSPFAACVVGNARQRNEADRQPDPSLQRSAKRLCADQSRKKDANDTKSPFTACVKGVNATRQAQQRAS